MTVQESVPNVGTSAGPAFCVFGGKPYLAWKGQGSDQGIYWTSASSLTPGSNGQYNWAPQTKVTNVATTDGPTLASFGGNLYMAWKGEAGDSGLYLSKFDGKTWTPQQKLVAGSSNGPALAATSKYLLMAWKGESDVGVYFFTSTDGTTWTAQQQIGPVGGTSSTPAVTASGNNVYMAWKAEPGDNRLFWSKYNGTTWSAQQLITSGTGVGPAIVCDSNNVIWLSWQAVAGQGIYYCSLTNESQNDWSPQVVRYGVGTSDRPAMISTGGGDAGVMMAWKGAGSDLGIWYGTLILPVPSSLTFTLPRTNIGRGSPSSMAIQAQLVMNQDGSCNFSGTFQNEAILDESWYIVFGVKDGMGHGYSFSTSGETTGTQTWNLSATNIAVAQNWGGIAFTNFFNWSSGDSAELLGSIEALFSDFGIGIKDVFEAIGNALATAAKEIFSDPSGEASAE